MTSETNRLTDYLNRFGLAEFRPGQREVIESILADEDSLCVMPTGGGKSLCYQLPAIAREGVTLVISPLIALMKDQVDSLTRIGVSAACINSTLTLPEQNERLDRLAAGGYDLVYVAPERFRNQRFIEIVKRCGVRLLAVDEAHCISEWGHDFRRDYARIGQFRRQIGNPQTVALTATATPEVQRDIVKQLELREPKIFLAGFSRPNLFYQVRGASGKRDKNEALIEFLRRTPGSGIIYASTRKGCEEVAELLGERTKRKACVYHGGLEGEVRRQRQEDFMEGRTEIAVATNAFGMGIDKADVRFVIHYNIPGTLEAYYQEAGRAGRDGRRADCLLLFSHSDRYVQEFFIDNAYPAPEVVRAVYEYLISHEEDPIEKTQQQIKEELELQAGAEAIGTCEQLLEKCGVLERVQPYRNMAVVRLESDLPTLVDLLPKKAEKRRAVLRAIEKLVGDHRFEPVYFQPSQLAYSLDMEMPALNMVLRELSKLEVFDYVPPFRGRAVHLRRRDQPFDALDLDFETLKLRRESEYAKLQRIVDFARGRLCRQREILRYFGAKDTSDCGHCDNCHIRGIRLDAEDATPAGGIAEAKVVRRAAPGATAPPTDAENRAVELTVRIALSGIARMHGRFGKTMVAAMLCGSKASKIAKWKLDRLSTFGLLGHLTQPEVVELLDGLVAAGLASQNDVDRYRPVIDLTPEGTEVMQGKEPLPGHFFLPPALGERIGRVIPAVAASEGVSSGTKPASKKENVRPADEPAARPSTPPAAKVPAERPKQRQVDVAPPPSDGFVAEEPSRFDDSAFCWDEAFAGRNPRPSYYWTCRLIDTDFTPAECAEIRRLDEDKLLDHLILGAENGLRVRSERVFTPEQLDLLENAIASVGDGRIRPIVEQLSGQLRYEQVDLYLKCRHGA